MTKFLLIRHGETAWHLPRIKGTKGWGVELAPLTAIGINQIRNLIPVIRTWSPDLLLTSPTTRTLTSCALILNEIKIPFEVEFDLHEWIPDLQFTWESIEEVKTAHNEMVQMGGEWPEGETCNWESLSSVRQRVTDVLKKYISNSRVAVICHELVIESLTGKKLGLAEYIEYEA